MGAVKDLWVDEVERICEDFAFERLTRDEARIQLIRKGFDPQEADDLLNATIE